MAKLVRIRRRSIMLFFLAIVGIAFLAIGWSGIPQKMLGIDEATPAATLATESKEKLQSGEEGEQTSPATTNVIKMPEEIAATGDNGSNYFVDYRLGRQRARGQRLEYLREIVNNPSSDPQVRSEAQEAIMAISNNSFLETELENLIKAKGFDDAVVSLKDDSANVVVKSENLTTEEAARISDLVARGTGVTEQNIVIIPKK